MRSRSQVSATSGVGWRGRFEDEVLARLDGHGGQQHLVKARHGGQGYAALDEPRPHSRKTIQPVLLMTSATSTTLHDADRRRSTPARSGSVWARCGGLV